jgi:hypothetical protein
MRTSLKYPRCQHTLDGECRPNRVCGVSFINPHFGCNSRKIKFTGQTFFESSELNNWGKTGPEWHYMKPEVNVTIIKSGILAIFSAKKWRFS